MHEIFVWSGVGRSARAGGGTSAAPGGALAGPVLDRRSGAGGGAHSNVELNMLRSSKPAAGWSSICSMSEISC